MEQPSYVDVYEFLFCWQKENFYQKEKKIFLRVLIYFWHQVLKL